MAAIAHACSNCTQSFRVISRQAGHNVRCPHCGASNAIAHALFEASASVRTPGFDGRPAGQALAAQPADLPDASPSVAAPDELHSGASRLQQLAQTVTASSRHLTRDRAQLERIHYTHSALARTTDFLARVILLLAIAVLVYVLVTTEWSHIADLPVRVALPAVALCLLPPVYIALVALTFMLGAHAIEYLARLAAASAER
jgi:hypothetical protein